VRTLIALSLVACVHAPAVQGPTSRPFDPVPPFSLGEPHGTHPSPDGKTVYFLRSGPKDLASALYAFDVASGKTRLVVKGGALWVVPSSGGTAAKVSPDSAGDVVYAQAEFVAAEEMNRYTGWWWAPDSHAVAYERYDASRVEHISIPDPADPLTPVDPSPYPRPGHKNVEVTLFVESIDKAGALPARVDWDHARYPYLLNVVWEKGGPLTLVVESRDQKDLGLLAASASDTLMPGTEGPVTVMRTAEIVHEHDDVFLDGPPRAYRWLEDGSGFLWSSEKEPGWDLELRRPDGALDHVVVPAEHDVRQLLHVGAGQVVVVGGPASEAVLERVPIAGGASKVLSPPQSMSRAVFGESGVYAMVVFGDDVVSEVHRADDGLAGVLPSVVEPWPVKPVVSVRRVGDFMTAVIHPRDFDPHRKYPVIDDVYGGPQANLVYRGALFYDYDQWLADRGFIVVRIDGRGTPHRGRAWVRAIAGKLLDVPLEDQVKGLAALEAIEPAMDASRIGVTGDSFGGFLAAAAVLRRPDVFHAAVAISPVTDWLDYDTYYTERYLGAEGDPQVYAASSLLDDAPKLSRPLLLVHGTADDNVLFRHTLRLADALLRAGRAFDLIPVVGETHMVGIDHTIEQRLNERMATFFADHL
jgi:dipeptidyl-peptidase-4